MYTGKIIEKIKQASERMASDAYYFKLLEMVESLFPGALDPILVLDEILDQNSILFRLLVDSYIVEIEMERGDSLGNLIQFDFIAIRSYSRSSCKAGRQKIEAARKILKSRKAFSN